MMRCVVGTWAEPHVPRPRRIARLLVPDHADGLVHEILRQVIALFGAVLLIDEPVVFCQVGIPLVGFAAEKSVIAVKAFLERPLFATGAGGNILFRHVVVLADPERAPAAVLQNLPDGCARIGDTAMLPGKSTGGLRDGRIARHVVIAS